MAGYARIQRWCLYVGLIALALMFVLMIVSSVDTFKAAVPRLDSLLKADQMGTVYTFQGAIGLAPQYKDGPCDAVCQEDHVKLGMLSCLCQVPIMCNVESSIGLCARMSPRRNVMTSIL